MGRRGPPPKHHNPTARRPSPPPHLTPEQAALWLRVVNSEDAGQFSTAATAAMLEEWVVRSCFCARLSALIEATPPGEILGDGGQDFDRLLRARDREARAVASAATKLRISNQSRMTPGAAGSGAGLPECDPDDPQAQYFN